MYTVHDQMRFSVLKLFDDLSIQEGIYIHVCDYRGVLSVNKAGKNGDSFSNESRGEVVAAATAVKTFVASLLKQGV